MPRQRLEQIDFHEPVTVNGNKTTQLRDDANARNPASLEYDSETGLVWVTPKRGDQRQFVVKADKFQAYPYVERKPETQAVKK